MNQNIPLSQLQEGQEARVERLCAAGPMRRRLQDIGLTGGARVVCLQKSPAGDPVAYLIRGAVIALRREDSQYIMMEGVQEYGADRAVFGACGH